MMTSMDKLKQVFEVNYFSQINLIQSCIQIDDAAEIRLYCKYCIRKGHKPHS